MLSILLISKPDPTPTHCPLTYEGSSNVISERRLQFFAQLEGWTLTHPIAPNCMVCPEPDRKPIWMAPSDICRRFGLDQTHPLCNSPIDNSQISHVKVCANMTQIIQAWNDGGCHYLSTELDATLTVPNIGYDGTLFCALVNDNIETQQIMQICHTSCSCGTSEEETLYGDVLLKCKPTGRFLTTPSWRTCSSPNHWLEYTGTFPNLNVKNYQCMIRPPSPPPFPPVDGSPKRHP